MIIFLHILWVIQKEIYFTKYINKFFEEFDKPKTKMFKEGKNLKFLFGNGRSVILSSISDEEVQFKFSTTDWEDVLNFLHNIEHLDKC